MPTAGRGSGCAVCGAGPAGAILLCANFQRQTVFPLAILTDLPGRISPFALLKPRPRCPAVGSKRKKGQKPRRSGRNWSVKSENRVGGLAFVLCGQNVGRAAREARYPANSYRAFSTLAPFLRAKRLTLSGPVCPGAPSPDENAAGYVENPSPVEQVTILYSGGTDGARTNMADWTVIPLLPERWTVRRTECHLARRSGASEEPRVVLYLPHSAWGEVPRFRRGAGFARVFLTSRRLSPQCYSIVYQ